MQRIVLGLLVASLLCSTGCFWHRRDNCGHYSKTSRSSAGMGYGCGECQTCGSPEMFGTPMAGSAMMQAPSAPVDERLSAPAKQSPYEGPARK